MAEAPHVPGKYVPLRQEPPREEAIGALAERQHGVVSLTQLKAVGLTASAVRKRVAVGRLRRIHRAVYATGHARLTREGNWMAAVLACGPTAVLSHRSAAALWGLRQDNRARTDVSLPSRSARPRPGIDVHMSSTLSATDVTTKDGIPCTTVARTLLDLADIAPERHVERAVEQAEVLRLFDLTATEDVLARSGGRRGAAVLRNVLAELKGSTLTVNDLEERFLALCRAASLPSPEVNQWLVVDDDPAIKADFLWRAKRLVIETDGFGSHGTRQAFERDRLRDQRLTLAGYTTLRVTQRQLEREPERVAATVAALHERRTSPPPASVRRRWPPRTPRTSVAVSATAIAPRRRPP